MLEVGRGARRGPERRRIERASPHGEQENARDAAADLEATRANVLVWHAVAREVKDGPEEEGRESRPAGGAGGGARRNVERDDHRSLPSRCGTKAAPRVQKTTQPGRVGAAPIRIPVVGGCPFTLCRRFRPPSRSTTLLKPVRRCGKSWSHIPTATGDNLLPKRVERVGLPPFRHTARSEAPTAAPRSGPEPGIHRGFVGGAQRHVRRCLR
jgi:hypothetical protein